ncbi:MAG: hypothetical protein N2383_04175 [Caldilineales bacterium]|nr:hypothetical protein [Caldilineales bacterium]
MTLTRHRLYGWFVLSVFVLVAVEFGIARLPGSIGQPDIVALAITADLVLGIPLLGYLFLVRTRQVSAKTLPVFFLTALVLAYAILPPHRRGHLEAVAWLIPLIELLLLALFVARLRSFRRLYRQARATAIFPDEALLAALTPLLGSPRLAALLTIEWRILAHALTGWWRTFHPQPHQQVFSYHRRNGYGLIVAALSLLLTVETVLVHLIVRHWSELAAWLLTLGSLYALLWIVGDYHAIRLHPIVLDRTHLHLRLGLRWRLSVPLTALVALRKPTQAEAKAFDDVHFGLWGEPQWVLELAEPLTAEGLFGRRRTVRRVGITVDDPKGLATALRLYLPESA